VEHYHEVMYGKKVLRKFSIDILTADKPQVKEKFQKYIYSPGKNKLPSVF
jgi:hypothetical protein